MGTDGATVGKAGRLNDCVGSGGNSSFVVFLGAGVEVGNCLGGGVGGSCEAGLCGGKGGDEGLGGTGGDEGLGGGGGGANGKSERGGTFGVLCGAAVELTILVDFAVDGVTLATVFWVVVGLCVVEVSTSLSFDLKSPVMPLKNPFFFVVASGASVVVVVLGIKGI